jgi:hypothetical protein
MKPHKIIAGIIFSLLLVTACQSFKTGNTPEADTIFKNKVFWGIKDTGVSFVSVADTITYDMIIKNPDTTDKWTTKRLAHLQKEKIIDHIFKQIYAQKIKAYDYFRDIPLTISEVKNIEAREAYSRDKIGKIQFTEKWYFDAENLKMQKEVISIVLGYESKNRSGEIKGYKPMFRIWTD